MSREDRLPYAFARQHGVLLEYGPQGPVCLARPAAPLAALAEVRRLAGQTVRLEQVTQDIFDARVSVVYRDDAVLASAAAGDAAGDGGGAGGGLGGGGGRPLSDSSS